MAKMNQPPPQWRRPRGVAAGTWEYVNERSIADHYDSFVADTPLCSLDTQILTDQFPKADSNDRVVIFDLGCGSGRTAIPLAKRGYQVIGVDLSSQMLRIMTEKAAADSVAERVHPIRANLVELGCFTDDSADHAICMFSTLGMIQGRRHRREMLSHAARIVRSGGTLVLHVHNRWSALREPGGVMALGRSWLKSWFDRTSEFGDAAYAYRGLHRMFMHRFSRRELTEDLAASGWQVEKVSPISIDGKRIDERTLIAGGYLVTGRV